MARSPSPPERHSGVHDARKCLKRLRSLLLLIRPGMPEPVFANLDRSSCCIAQGPAPARDAHALIDAIDKLEGDAEDASREQRPIQSLRAWLHRTPAMRPSKISKGARRRMPCADFSSVRPALAGLAVYPDDFRRSPRVSGTPIARRAMRLPEAFASGSDEDLHEWRKARAASLAADAVACTRAGRRSLSARVEAARACRKSSATTTTSRC